jgi:ABC-type phosphonate transport system ATPase subunit
MKLDLLRTLVRELNLAVIIVTHDLGVARLLAHRLLACRVRINAHRQRRTVAMRVTAL